MKTKRMFCLAGAIFGCAAGLLLLAAPAAFALARSEGGGAAGSDSHLKGPAIAGSIYVELVPTVDAQGLPDFSRLQGNLEGVCRGNEITAVSFDIEASGDDMIVFPAAQGRSLVGWIFSTGDDVTLAYPVPEECNFAPEVNKIVIVSGRKVVHGTNPVTGNPTITADVVVLGSVPQ